MEKDIDKSVFLEKKADQIMTILSDDDLPCQSEASETSKADDDTLSIKAQTQVDNAHPKLIIRDDTTLSETSKKIGALEGVFLKVA